MASLKEHYQTLGLVEFASAEAVTQDDIRNAYRQLARQLHPDKNLNDPQATVKFQKLTQAYEILSDPVKRSVYDSYGEKGLDQYSNSGEFGNLFSHPLFSSKYRWVAFLFLWALFSALNHFSQWPIDWHDDGILLGAGTSYFGPISTFLTNFSAHFFKEQLGGERKFLAKYFAFSVLLFFSFVTFHLLPTRLLIWATEIVTCLAFLLLLNQGGHNWDLSFVLGIVAMAIDPKLRTNSAPCSKYSQLLSAYVLLNGFVTCLFLAICLTLPRPVTIKKSHFAVPIAKFFGRNVVWLYASQSGWNWILFLIFNSVLIFDHFFASRFFPRIEILFPVLKHLVIDGLQLVVILFSKKKSSSSKKSFLGRQCIAIGFPFLVSRYVFSSSDSILVCNSVLICLCVSRIAYLITVNSGNRSVVHRWWSAVLLASLCFLIELYTRGFSSNLSSASWKRTASFALGCYALIFVELWQWSSAEVARAFSDLEKGEKNESEDAAGHQQQQQQQQQPKHKKKHRR